MFEKTVKCFGLEEKHATPTIIDWKYTDVWKYLIENNFKYNKVYDKMYMLGNLKMFQV
jgi:predicted phosphoadenosine phosphosulfate sulfurtransferase